MRAKWVGAAVAAVVACGWAQGAEAATFTIKGLGIFPMLSPSDTYDGQFDSISRPYEAFTITYDSGPFFMSKNGYFIANTLDTSGAIIGTNHQYYFRGDEYFMQQLVVSKKLSTSYFLTSTGTAASYQDNYPESRSGDDTFIAGFEIPAFVDNVESPLGFSSRLPLGTGSLRISGSGFETEADIIILSVSINSVPIPSAAPLFGGALISLGGLAYARRRNLRPTA